jgi:MoaA/NifB/PqqE/SkfB family radical SAM enzyme
MESPQQHAQLVPPGFLLAGSAQRLLVHDVLSGAQLALEGEAAQAVLRGRTDGALQALCRFEPSGVLSELRSALDRHAPVALTRAALLKGDGYGQLFIELGARCNERCVHCYAESSPERSEALSERAVREALEDAAELGFARLQLTGGDPLISDLCEPAARYARELGLPDIEVYTNGLALSGRLYEALAALGVRFAFSFYSHDPETHDAITRTPGSQRRTLAAIRRVAEAGLGVRASVIVMDQNRDDLEPTVQLLQEAGVARDAIGADVQRSVGRGLMTIRPKQADIGRVLGAAGAGHRQGAPKQPAAELPDASGRAAVGYDGTVFPCIFSRAFPLGHLPEQRLRAILRDETPLVVDLERLAGEYSQRSEQLACWDCRMRATVLGMQ